MSAISVHLPDSLNKMAREVASDDHISLNQFIASAVAEMLSTITTESYLAARAARGSVEKFHAALTKVPAVEPEEFDRM